MNTRKQYSLEGCVAAVLFIILICVVMLQILGRVDLFTAPVWTEELARWIWVWMAFIAVGEVERTDGHLRMEMLADLMGPRFKLILYTIVDIIYLAATAYLCHIGYKTIMRTWYNESVTLPFTDAALYASYFVASFLIMYRVAQRIYRHVRALKSAPAEGV
ncbi:TRAP transporter small permease [Pseudovibrio exalbescens]|uniref:TRAP transporter small permease protein n=1 Tax=Pseudovibrio exalbescens TaxID=197461 RepID=A0A1U7JGK4_9HYPH|nr:TRAP transporter small permease [Pseudovibrio exalbescens]OKL43828.1 hypothetical protein A3843_12005 [Pseudovibrio exalbescens]